MKDANKTTYTIQNISEKLAERHGISKKAAFDTVKDVFDIVLDTVVNSKVGDELKINKLFVISTKMTKAGVRRNPKTQETVNVPSKKVAKFRALPSFKTELNPDK